MRTIPERRTSDRTVCRLQGHCLFPRDRDRIRWPAAIRDLSAEGVGWTLDCCFEPGTVLSLDVHNRNRAVSVSKLVEVRHVHRDGPGGWRLGGAFTTRLSEEELVALL